MQVFSWGTSSGHFLVPEEEPRKLCWRWVSLTQSLCPRQATALSLGLTAAPYKRHLFNYWAANDSALCYRSLGTSGRPRGPASHWLLSVKLPVPPSLTTQEPGRPDGGRHPRPGAPAAPPKPARLPTAGCPPLCCFSRQALRWELNTAHGSSVPGAGSPLCEHRTKMFSGLLSTVKWP